MSLAFCCSKSTTIIFSLCSSCTRQLFLKFLTRNFLFSRWWQRAPLAWEFLSLRLQFGLVLDCLSLPCFASSYYPDVKTPVFVEHDFPEVLHCGPGELECNFPADGCIPVEKVADGHVDCFRDGYDELIIFKKIAAFRIFPEGQIKTGLE